MAAAAGSRVGALSQAQLPSRLAPFASWVSLPQESAGLHRRPLRLPVFTAQLSDPSQQDILLNVSRKSYPNISPGGTGFRQHWRPAATACSAPAVHVSPCFSSHVVNLQDKGCKQAPHALCRLLWVSAASGIVQLPHRQRFRLTALPSFLQLKPCQAVQKILYALIGGRRCSWGCRGQRAGDCTRHKAETCRDTCKVRLR
jgi:hypothetical protein